MVWDRWARGRPLAWLTEAWARYGLAVALHVLAESDASLGRGHDRCERGLADLKRIAPQVVAVQHDEVEGVEEYATRLTTQAANHVNSPRGGAARSRPGFFRSRAGVAVQ